MVDQERPPVGSVAEEAARLLDALGGWAASSGYAAGAARPATSPDPAPTAGPADSAGPAESADPGDPVDPSDSAAAADPASSRESAPPSGHCEHCGAENGAGRAVVCGLCPVCQGIGLLRSVRPETVDRLADLAGVLAGTLRDLADHRRAAAGSTGAPGAGGAHAGAQSGGPDAGPRPTRSRVQDIAVDDETTATS